MHAIGYALWLIKEIYSIGFSLAIAAFKKDPGYNPVVLRYPLRITSAWEIFWFTSSITATPGTLSLGLREPPREGLPRIVLVQAVQGSDPAAVMADLADMEQRLAPHVKGLSYGVPGQEDTTTLDRAFYEYPLDSVGRKIRAPELAREEDEALDADSTAKTKVWPTPRKGRK